MPLSLQFLGWTDPALPAAAEWLVRKYRAAGQLDLGRTILVLPGARAGRRLLELLVERAEAQALLLTPPKITTEHELPELLYQPQRPFASQLTQQLVWAEVLEKTPTAIRQHFLPYPPAAGDLTKWLQLADLLRRLHVELAADGYNFRHVLENASALPGFAEHDRWEALAQVQTAYLRRLDALEEWDKQTARLVAIEQREPHTDREIVLVGMADLNRAQRQMLDLVADHVTSLVFAPAELAERFDDHGCLVPTAWAEAPVPLNDEQIVRTGGAADQADAVTDWLAELGGQYRAEQIVIGVADERLAPHLVRQLAQCGVRTRWVEARRLSETPPYRLLQLLAELGRPARFADLASLVRHPDFFDWLERALSSAGHTLREDPLSALDRFAAQRVPAILDPAKFDPAKFDPARPDADRHTPDADGEDLAKIGAPLGQLLDSLPQRQSLTDWATSIRQVLSSIYAGRTLDRNLPAERMLLQSFDQIAAGLAEIAAIPASLVPQTDLAQAFHLTLSPLADTSLPPPAESNVVEILGWLELPLDDSPAAIVTTFSEGFVPSSTSADPFLPNRLRQTLGIVHNDRRLARDAYATTLLAHSRQALRVVVPRRDVEQNPLAPSRLLFAANTATITRRALAFFGEAPATRPRRNLLAGRAPILPVSNLPIPRPIIPAEPPERFSVTSFRAYLACPYRYYLRNVLGLVPLSDSFAELDPAAFGSLLHQVLERFGRADDAREVRDSSDPARVFEYLSDWLTSVQRYRFGEADSRAAVRIQVEQARTRLRSFSDWQADRIRAGWRIVHSENSDDRKGFECPFGAGASRATIHGRIDRIDFHEATQALAVLDYKTAESGQTPENTHRQGDDWIDLQLPLYRHLAAAAGLPQTGIAGCRIELGYILLPKDARKVGAAVAEWSPQELESADAIARNVIQLIREGVFWPPTADPPAFADDLASITQDHRLGSWRDEDQGAAP
jgi:ATP-dependent helicase/nuclease subunit B